MDRASEGRNKRENTKEGCNERNLKREGVGVGFGLNVMERSIRGVVGKGSERTGGTSFGWFC